MTELEFLRQWHEEERQQKELEQETAAALLSERLSKLRESTISQSVAKTWCDPLSHCEIVGIDFGAGTFCWHKLHAGISVSKIPLKDAYSVLTSFDRGTLVIVERAHLATPQTNQSLAQPFTANELQRIYTDCAANGITLRLFPHHHTRKCRDWAAKHAPPGLIDATKSTDINDAKGLAYYVCHNNGVALGKPPESFDSDGSRLYASAVRKISNVVLNAAAARGYDGQVFRGVARIAARIPAAMQTQRDFVNDKVAFSIASLAVTEHRGVSVKFVYKGDHAPGANMWLRHVVGSSSVHHRGGRARSNMMWHRFRPFLKDFAAREFCLVTKKNNSYIKFAEYTPDLDACRRAAWKKVRQELKLAYRIAVDLSSDFKPFDPVQQKWEV